MPRIIILYKIYKIGAFVCLKMPSNSDTVHRKAQRKQMELHCKTTAYLLKINLSIA